MTNFQIARCQCFRTGFLLLSRFHTGFLLLDKAELGSTINKTQQGGDFFILRNTTECVSPDYTCPPLKSCSITFQLPPSSKPRILSILRISQSGRFHTPEKSSFLGWSSDEIPEFQGSSSPIKSKRSLKTHSMPLRQMSCWIQLLKSPQPSMDIKKTSSTQNW
ncbi:hypothetical protein CRE_07074 [Caenorhabditis remanei]|uniref:Uncharacterized protein n=1 Tax=Caenorhabditis remanei TaxID=31234 RepID=E3NJG6_CAERE|nr:hypothetical protein CRE_07074 [Caenorhabditis remanei]